MAGPGAELSRLRKVMGHASPETTSRYVHHADVELAIEHRRSSVSSMIRWPASSSSGAIAAISGRRSRRSRVPE
jgi:hypothetical protein